MLNPSEQILKVSKANIETSLILGTLSIDGAAQIFQRQLDFAKAAVQEQREAAQVEPSELAEVYNEQFRKMLNLSEGCLEIAVQTQTEMVRAIRNNLDGITKEVASEMSTVLQAAEQTANHVQDEVAAAKPRKKSQSEGELVRG